MHALQCLHRHRHHHHKQNKQLLDRRLQGLTQGQGLGYRAQDLVLVAGLTKVAVNAAKRWVDISTTLVQEDAIPQFGKLEYGRMVVGLRYRPSLSYDDAKKSGIQMHLQKIISEVTKHAGVDQLI